MTDQQEDTDKGARKERSPSFPFISLKKAVDRLKEMADAHRRNQARMVTVGATWGYAAKSSGLLQTVAALKAFGLIDDIGGAPDRKIQVSDLGWRILQDARPGAREGAIREAAVKPRLIAEYVNQWIPERPSDAHCLSELQLDRGFNDVAAKLFLKVFDETVAYANLKDGDSMSPNLEMEPSSAMSQPSVRSARSPTIARDTYVDMPGPGDHPASVTKGLFGDRPDRNAAVPRATLPLPEGIVALEIPNGMSGKSWQALKQWVDLMVSFAEPKGAPADTQAGYKIDLEDK